MMKSLWLQFHDDLHEMIDVVVEKLLTTFPIVTSKCGCIASIDTVS